MEMSRIRLLFGMLSIALAACGLETIPLLMPPIDTSGDTDPEFTHDTANDTVSGFKGYRIYYKLNDKSQTTTTDQNRINGTTQPGTQLLTSNGYTEIVSGTFDPAGSQTEDTKYKIRFSPHIKDFTAGQSFTFKFEKRDLWDAGRQTQNSELLASTGTTSTGDDIYYTEAGDEIVFRQNLSSSSNDNDPTHGSFDSGTLGDKVIFIAVIAEGRDTQGKQFFSTPVVLQKELPLP